MSLHFPLVNVNEFFNESQPKACRRIQYYAEANKLPLDAESAGRGEAVYSTERGWTIPSFSISIGFCRGGEKNIGPIRAGRNLDDTGGRLRF
jgi:hypothetical protein